MPHLRLMIIGSSGFKDSPVSDYERSVLAEIEKAGGRIRMTGYVDNDRLYRYYQAADFQVVPSIWEEAAGLVTIEGMLSGLPLVVTRSGGMVEYVDESCALLVDRGPSVIENLAQAILKMAKDGQLRAEMSKAAAQRGAKFSKKKMYEDFLQVFEI